MENRLLTVRELAQELRLSRWTIYDLAAQGKIPHLRVGGVLRFDLQEVRAFCERAAEAAVAR